MLDPDFAVIGIGPLKSVGLRLFMINLSPVDFSGSPLDSTLNAFSWGDLAWIAVDDSNFFTLHYKIISALCFWRTVMAFPKEY